MGRASFVLLLTLATGCVRSKVTQCGDTVCPEDSRCTIYPPTNGTFCTPAEDPQCEDKPDGTLCDDEQGTCYGGGCLAVGCGNGVIDDPVFARAEECDDGNRRSHDGCSSSCTNEVATWTIEAPAPAPPRTGHAMAYDAPRDAIVLFGGVDQNSNTLDETWLRVAGHWRYVRPAAARPPARSGHALAYDAARERVMMFGGLLATGELGADTWAWDGARWTPLAPAHAPSPRAGHAMAYDAVRGVVVLFGGQIRMQTTTRIVGDTWVWNGDDWTEVAGTGPPPMNGHAMVFDPARGKIVLLGAAPDVQTWTFDGASWSRASGGEPPSAGTLAYDPVTKTVLWTGDTAGALVQWQWDGTAWGSRPVSALPPVRDGAAAVTDSTGPYVLGGVEVITPSRDERSWDGSRWYVPPPGAIPSPRSGMSISVDPRTGRLAVFGSLSNSAEVWSLANGVWTLDATPFPLLDPADPSRAVFDEALGATVVVRGAKSATWDGAVWRTSAFPAPAGPRPQLAYVPGAGTVLTGAEQLPSQQPLQANLRDGDGRWTTDTAAGPSARSRHAAGYDPVAKELVIFGGLRLKPNAALQYFADTHTWDPATRAWAPQVPLRRPAPRINGTLAWDPARQRLALLGGDVFASPAQDVWEWNRAPVSWDEVVIAGRPPADPLAAEPLAAVSAPDGDGIAIVHAAPTSEGPEGLVVYRLRWDGPGPPEACRPGLDLDHDGKAGCDDPDCAVGCALAARAVSTRAVRQ